MRDYMLEFESSMSLHLLLQRPLTKHIQLIALMIPPFQVFPPPRRLRLCLPCSGPRSHHVSNHEDKPIMTVKRSTSVSNDSRVYYHLLISPSYDNFISPKPLRRPRSIDSPIFLASTHTISTLHAFLVITSCCSITQ